MAGRTDANLKRGAQRYYQPALRPWGDDDRMVLADLLLDGHEPGEIARILNRYMPDVLRAIRAPETDQVQRWLITCRYEARFHW